MLGALLTMKRLFGSLFLPSKCQSAKAPGSFAMPNVEDISAVEKDDIVMCLAQPIHSATTKRVAASVHFSINLAHFKCQ